MDDKGAVVSFRNNAFANPEGLVRYLTATRSIRGLVNAVEAGATRQATARRFGVSVSCVVKLMQRRRRTGTRWAHLTAACRVKGIMFTS